MLLLSCNYGMAMKSLSVAIKESKINNDTLWLGGAIESYGIALYLTNFQSSNTRTE